VYQTDGQTDFSQHLPHFEIASRDKNDMVVPSSNLVYKVCIKVLALQV